MAPRRNLLYLASIIAAVVLPSAVALGWYHVSQDPNFRPLGVTKEALRAYSGGTGGGIEIVARVEWVAPRTGGYTRRHLTDAIRNAFAAKGIEARVVFFPGAETTRVTYVVGQSVIGPYSTARAAEGVSAAVEALRMYPEIED